MTTSTQTTGPTPVRMMQLMLGAICAGVVVLGAVIATIVDGWEPVLLHIGIVVVLGAVAFVATQQIGFRVEAISPEATAGETALQARGRFHSSTFLRMALSESVAIIGLVLAIVGSSGTTYAVAAVIALALILLTAWPTGRNIARVEAQLDRDGAASRLKDVLHTAAPAAGTPDEGAGPA